MWTYVLQGEEAIHKFKDQAFSPDTMKSLSKASFQKKVINIFCDEFCPSPKSVNITEVL